MKPSNETLQQDARTLFPGGVNSPVRAFRRVGGTPLTFIQGKGPWVTDADGNRYLDFVCAWGSLIHGHAHGPTVKAAVQRVRSGSSFGAPTREENNLGSLLKDLIPGLRLLRFVSSGTEAVMSAIRLARAATGRDLILKFDGCYHGHSDGLLVKAGSGVAEGTQPDSAGIPPGCAQNTISIPYNDLPALDALFTLRGHRIAAIIVEPIAANMGLVLPQAGFLAQLRTLCDRHGALLIFDEVITGFRVHLSGAQAWSGVQADLVCLGKIMGGGFPAAAFGGRQDLMELLAPLGPVYQAGTLSGNPVAMAAGYATLKALQAPGVFSGLVKRSTAFANSLGEWARCHNFSVCSIGAMFGLACARESPKNWVDAAATDQKAYANLFHRVREAGIYLAPSPFETCFISTSHRERDLEMALRRLQKSLL